MKKTNYILIFTALTSLLFWNCKLDQKTKKEINYEYDTLQNGMVRVKKTELVYDIEIQRLIEKKSYTNNPNNDNFIKLISGISNKDSISLYSIDSLFYKTQGFDTITVTYKKSNNKWRKQTVESKKYNESDSLIYLRIVFFEVDGKIEEFKKYSKNGYPFSITRYECNIRKKGCDSIFKKFYIYDKNGKFKYTQEKTWKENEWKEIECF